MSQDLDFLFTRLDDIAVGIPRLAEISESLKKEIKNPSECEQLRKEIQDLRWELRETQADLEEAHTKSEFSEEMQSWLRNLYKELQQNNVKQVLIEIQHLFWHYGKTL